MVMKRCWVCLESSVGPFCLHLQVLAICSEELFSRRVYESRDRPCKGGIGHIYWGNLSRVFKVGTTQLASTCHDNLIGAAGAA